MSISRSASSDDASASRAIPPLTIGDDDLDEGLEILTKAVQLTNEKMIGIVDPEVRKKRNFVGWIVAVAGACILILIYRALKGHSA